MQNELLVIAGKRGRGKTAFAVKEILETLKIGKTVWCNFPISLATQKKTAKWGHCYFADSLDDLVDMRDGLFVIDEAHFLASGRWKTITKDTHALIALSRHLGMRILFISQNFRRLDPIIRELTDGVLILKKIGRLSYGRFWVAEDLSEEGRPKAGVRSYDSITFWHKKNIHEVYDDRDLLLDFLKNRKIRNWRLNETGLVGS